ncbi:FeoA family protein [Peptostreptococcaceae bacterium AGR-M142]
MPLAMLSQGDSAVVKAIKWGNEMKKRLTGMGLIEGSPIKLISSSGKDGFILDVKGSRLVVGRTVALKILVDNA